MSPEIPEIPSRGKFSLKKKDNCCHVKGHVENHWYDTYDWDAGKLVVFPDKSIIKDTEVGRLTKEGSARNFIAESYWHQVVTADEPNPRSSLVWSWKEVVAGRSGQSFAEPPFGERMMKALAAQGLDRHGKPSKQDNQNEN